MLPTYMNSWSRIAREQQKIVSNKIVERDEKYGKLLKYYRFEDKIAWGDSQIKSQIQCNPEYVQICKDIVEQTYYLEYVKDTLETIKGNHFIVQEYNKMTNKMEGVI